MERRLTVFLFVVSLPALPQNMADYYRLPGDRARQERQRAHFGEAETSDRWYLGIEGLLRQDRSRLEQTFGGLVSTRPVTRIGWSLMAGWVRYERWALEAGYANSPIHTFLQISNGLNLFTFRFENERHSLLIRGRRFMRFDGRSGRRAGIWLGAGFWLVPNSGKPLSRLAFEGYESRGRRSRPDTLRLMTDTRLSGRPSALVEASAEYGFPLGDRLEAGIFLRRTWGLGHSIRTDMTYVVTNQTPRHAALRSDGSGWSFGVALRYTTGTRYRLKETPRVEKSLGTRLN